MLCDERILVFNERETEKVNVPCNTSLNEKGRCPNAENHIRQTDKQCNHAGCAGGPCDKPAQRGRLTKDDSKAGDTWLREARGNVERAIGYFRRAAVLYEKCDRKGDAEECQAVVNKLIESQEYVRYIDRH